MDDRVAYVDRSTLVMRGHRPPGKTLWRHDAGFDEAVLATSFGACDPGVRPDALVQANSASDVVRAVHLAIERGWRIACCSGGHGWSQNHIRDGGLLIDLSRLNAIEIDAASATATIGCACLSGDLDAALARHGLFFPVAHAYTVGLGGFLLQGFFGWNSRVAGLGCENVIGADVVLADGRLIHASEGQNSDVFWALRGAGPGFFGIVVCFHLRLQRRPAFTGLKMQVFRIRHLDEVLRWAQTIGPTVSPKVELQILLTRKAFGIFAHGIEIVTPVLGRRRALLDGASCRYHRDRGQLGRVPADPRWIEGRERAERGTPFVTGVRTVGLHAVAIG